MPFRHRLSLSLSLPLALSLIGGGEFRIQSCNEMALELVSGADFRCDLHYVPSRSPSKGSRGPPRAPMGRKSEKKNRAGCISLSSLRSAQQVVDVGTFSAGLGPRPGIGCGRSPARLAPAVSPQRPPLAVAGRQRPAVSPQRPPFCESFRPAENHRFLGSGRPRGVGRPS